MKGRRVLVQGAGDVGGKLIGYLRGAGADVVFSEVDQGAIQHFRDELGVDYVPPEGVYTTECDVFAPCALGGVLNAETIPRLRCRAVAGSANNQLDQQGDAERLRSRGILYAPYYLINVGGVMAVLGLEVQGWKRDTAEQEVVRSVRSTLTQIFESAEEQGITTEAAARRIAEGHLGATGT